jgi:HPt (histidine-containing phosphotransfer) domain-containing protein
MRGIFTALAERNAEALVESAHSLKSSSANLGALALTELCKELETAGRQGRLADASELLQQVNAVYTNTLQALEAHRESCAQRRAREAAACT